MYNLINGKENIQDFYDTLFVFTWRNSQEKKNSYKEDSEIFSQVFLKYLTLKCYVVCNENPEVSFFYRVLRPGNIEGALK